MKLCQLRQSLMITCRVLTSSITAIPLLFLHGIHPQKLLLLHRIGFEYRKNFYNNLLVFRCLNTGIYMQDGYLSSYYYKYAYFLSFQFLEGDLKYRGIFSQSRIKKKLTNISKMPCQSLVCHDLSGMVFFCICVGRSSQFMPFFHRHRKIIKQTELHLA